MTYIYQKERNNSLFEDYMTVYVENLKEPIQKPPETKKMSTSKQQHVRLLYKINCFPMYCQ